MIDRLDAINYPNDYPYMNSIDQVQYFDDDSSTQLFQTLYEEPQQVISPNDINMDYMQKYFENNDNFLEFSQPKYIKIKEKEEPKYDMEIDYHSDDEESTMTLAYSTNLGQPNDFCDDEFSNESFNQTLNDSYEEMTVEYPNECEVDYSSFAEGGTVNPNKAEEYSIVLDPSKAPVLEALSFCIVMRIGAYQTPELEAQNKVAVTSLNTFLDGIRHFCTKKNPTDNEEARVKSLKLWFSSIPKRNMRHRPFIMDIKANKVKPLKNKINKMKRFAIEHGVLRPMM